MEGDPLAEEAELWVSDREPVTVKCGPCGGFVGVEVVGLGVLPLGGLGCCTPDGMNSDGVLPVMGFEGLYGTDTGRTPGLTGDIPTR